MVAIGSIVASLSVSTIPTMSTISTVFRAAKAEAAAASAAAYLPVMPCRLADTRLPSGYTKLDAQTLAIATRNRCGIPATAGFLTAWPADQSRPVVSTLNFAQGQVRANGSTVRLDSGGAFRVYTSVVADVVVDVVG